MHEEVSHIFKRIITFWGNIETVVVALAVLS
jgi:hypothetical protein